MSDSLDQEIRSLRNQYWSSRDPDGRAFAPLADAYRKRGDLEEAFALVEDGIGRLPEFASGHLVAALVARDMGDAEGARWHLDRVLDLDAENVSALIERAEVALHAGDREEGLLDLREVLRLEPGHKEAKSLLDSVEAGLFEGTEATGEVEAIDIEERGGATDEYQGEPFEEEPWMEETEEEITGPVGDTAEAEALDTFDPAELATSGAEETATAGAEETATAGAEETATPEPEEPDAPGERDFVGAGPHDALEELSGEEWEPPAHTVSDDRLLRTRTMGELYARQGFVDRAIEIFEHLVSANPDDADLVERLGQMRAQYPAARPHAEGSPPDEVGEESGPAAVGGEGAPAASADEGSPAAVDRERSPVVLGEAGVAEAGASGPRGGDAVRERPISAYFEDLLAWVPGAVPIESLAPDSEKAPRDAEPPSPDAPMVQVGEDESGPDTSAQPQEDGDREDEHREDEDPEDEDRGDEDMDDFQSWLQSLQP